jgi:hypothetical protein
MKNIAASLLCLCVFCSLALSSRAQSTSRKASLRAPILPMDIVFRHVSQYLMQRIEGDPRYSKIEALLDPDRDEVILTNKTTGKIDFYTSSPRRLEILQAHHLNAYLAPVKTEDFITVDGYSASHIRLVDNQGQEIDWEFIADPIVLEAKRKIISEPNEHGVLWIYAPRRATAAAGSVVTIGGTDHPAPQSASNQRDQGLYAEDLTIAEVLSGTRTWIVRNGPDSLTEGASWDLKAEGGPSRQLVVKGISNNTLQIEQTNGNEPDAPPFSLELDFQSDGYSLRSVCLRAGFDKFWIFFDPGLPLPSGKSDRVSGIVFSIAEDEQASVADGNLTVQRSPDGEKVRSNLVGYVRRDARSDRFPPSQTIIPTAFRSQSGCRQYGNWRFDKP